MAYKKNYNSLLPDDFVLSKEFESIVEQLENTKDHFYITGKAGSGKSTLLAYFRSITQKNTAVLAPTGVAAIRVKGQTIHSFFGFPPKVIQTRHIKKVRQIELLQNLETLIIDEISIILSFRMATNDPGMIMPELGRSLVHREGLALVSDWINSLEGQCL